MNIIIHKNKNIGAEVNSADARELHTFLQSGQDYSDWIKNRIDQYDFIEGQDYVTETVSTAGRPRKEYFITLDMAKELCMVENNNKGKEARRYFIEVERAFISSEQSRLSKLEERIAEQDALILEQKDAIYAERKKVSELREDIESKALIIARYEKKAPVLPPKITTLQNRIRELEGRVYDTGLMQEELIKVKSDLSKTKRELEAAQELCKDAITYKVLSEKREKEIEDLAQRLTDALLDRDKYKYRSLFFRNAQEVVISNDIRKFEAVFDSLKAVQDEIHEHLKQLKADYDQRPLKLVALRNMSELSIRELCDNTFFED
ncbi:antA/AntB antirepressor family protein [Campylobacter sp. MOP7]|uniref:antA/AntB antirepressor family protein n=1 Tax=Campylobacter canis TaxID=3378588 RepID=UPI00387E31B7